MTSRAIQDVQAQCAAHQGRPINVGRARSPAKLVACVLGTRVVHSYRVRGGCTCSRLGRRCFQLLARALRWRGRHGFARVLLPLVFAGRRTCFRHDQPPPLGCRRENAQLPSSRTSRNQTGQVLPSRFLCRSGKEFVRKGLRGLQTRNWSSEAWSRGGLPNPPDATSAVNGRVCCANPPLRSSSALRRGWTNLSIGSP